MQVVIVGGGIAGLAAALGLRRAGHIVHIYERSAFLNEIGAALNVGPNASRPLMAFGLDPVRARFVPSSTIWVGEGDTLSTRYSVDPNTYGAPWYFAHRVDLHEELKRLATGDEGAGVPAVVHLRRTVQAFDPETPSITLADGEVISADMIIVADGIHSTGAEIITGHETPVMAPAPGRQNFTYRFLIPTADIDADARTRGWVAEHDGRNNSYHCNGNNLVTYPCRNREIQNFAMYVCSDDVASGSKEDWLRPVDKSELLDKFTGWHPQFVHIAEKATEIKKWPLLVRAPLPRWTRGRMALAGDAAHPMEPHLGQGGAQSIEDGTALGIVFSGATPEEVPERLKLYETVRRNRASLVQLMSSATGDRRKLVKDAAKSNIPIDVLSDPNIDQPVFGYDVIHEAIQRMREDSPEFELPPDFFVREPARGQFP
ncbi:salicylate hydroxylase [Thozetella sp. PMI_491]|nr:salicylate hydroxylase [Thozetella sp. PMI_491]